MKNHHLLLIIGMIGLLLVLPSCKSQFKEPEVTYVRTQIINVSMTKADVVFIFDVYNPNNISINTLSANYRVYIDGVPVIVQNNIALKLPAKQRTQFQFPGRVYYKSIYKSSAAMADRILTGKKTAPYEVRATFYYKVMIVSGKIPVVYKGRFPLPDISKRILPKLFRK